MQKTISNLCVVTCVVVFTVNILALQTTATFKADRWRGLLLDQSSPEEAIKALGQPAEDKTDRLHIRNLDKWLSPRQEQKAFRILIYKTVDEAKKVELDFADNKLVRIHFDYDDQKFLAKELSPRIGTDFVLVERGVPANSSPAMYEGQKEAIVPKIYPTFYYLVSVQHQSFVSAYVAGKGKAALKEIFRVSTIEPFPGSVLFMDIVSRSLTVDGTSKPAGHD